IIRLTSFKLAWPQSQRQSWTQLLSIYTAGAHIHGFYQLFWPTMRQRMRILWALALMSACYVLIYVSYLLAERFQRRTIHTIVSNSHWPISSIAFPVVIVCNKNRLNWSRVPLIKQRYNISDKQSPLFERVLSAYDALQFQHFQVFAELAAEPLLHTLNHLNFTQIVTELAWRCDELLADCSWHTQSVDCCEVFRPRRVLLGACLEFNELEQRASIEVGKGKGLRARLMLNAALHAPANALPKGFVLNILEPTVWFNFPIELLPHTNVDIGITAVYHYYDENTYVLNSKQRECLHENEQFKTLQNFNYMLENCQAECQQLYMLRYCNCSLDLFYPPSNHKPCQLADLSCLAANNQHLQNYAEPGEEAFVVQRETEKGMHCDCQLNCKSLTLLTDIYEHVQPIGVQQQNGSIMMDVYYKRKDILVYKTSLVYSWLDLIVSFGGICQLCLGCSIISLIELCYFTLVDVPFFCWTRFA
ncbi:ppk14, partial [Drosophila busckii]